MHNSEIEELGLAAQSMGATILRGALTYPSDNGGFALGDVELDQYLYQLRRQELMLIVVPLGEARKVPTICGLCMTSYAGDECPTCRVEREEAKRVIERRLRRRAQRDEQVR